MERQGLRITVHRIKGHCPVYREGDSFFLQQGYILPPDQRVSICLHSLASILPYHVALFHGVPPAAIGLAKEGKSAYVQCLDPCDLTGGGTVTFMIEKV
ncbi:MAG: TIGR04076 family protein [candidate division KSB1 bacterium]|nr:TIGR04076 family protein [candidate division KSB1 bacterium]MDZ7386079.1 TIGR04076 family protein [candidate division KSB1 bacterium]MDZ7391342.1 TIGR04076 family protein [candidate division KSB1 bacterium]